jgi:hypothetical protein
VAVCLTLSTPYVFRIIVSSYSGLAKWVSSNKRVATTDEETQRLTTTTVMANAKSGRHMLHGFYDLFRQKESRIEIRHQFFCFFILYTICFVFFSQVIASSILTDKTVTDPVGLLASNTCGLYEYDNEKFGEEEASRIDNRMVKREGKAAPMLRNAMIGETITRAKL